MLVAASFALSMLGAGCSSMTVNPQSSTVTGVQLSENNYKLVKAGVIGRSYGFKLLGILPLASPSAGVARSELYRSAGQSLAGKSIALANVTEDRASTYLIAFSIPRLIVTADIIEFTDRSGTLKGADHPAQSPFLKSFSAQQPALNPSPRM
ncbi:MAG: DUF6567 family protein [Verrucomicrobiota bacterium]